MPKYRICYTEESYGSILFDAENLEEARELYEQVRNGELDPDDVFLWQKTNESGTTFTNLEEVGE